MANTNTDHDWLFEDPSPEELDAQQRENQKNYYKQQVDRMPGDEKGIFLLALDLGLIQAVEGDDQLLVISEVKKADEGVTSHFDRTRHIPTLTRILKNRFGIKLLLPSEVKFRANLLGKTEPLTDQAVFLERKDLELMLQALGHPIDKVINQEIFVAKFPEVPTHLQTNEQ